MPRGPKTRTYDDKMKLDMPLAEALERFAGVDPKQMHANIKRAKKKKPPGEKKTPGGKDDDKNVVNLRDRRMRKRNYGR
jgi:hypothetical protein